MSRTIALNMTRPHERLGIKKPAGRRLSNAFIAWNVVFFAIAVVMAVGYIVQVNRASARGFALRDVEQHIENVHTEVLILEDKVARLSSIESLGERADELGLVPTNYAEYIHPASQTYALK